MAKPPGQGAADPEASDAEDGEGQLHWVEPWSKDADAVVPFYRDVFGFEVEQAARCTSRRKTSPAWAASPSSATGATQRSESSSPRPDP